MENADLYTELVREAQSGNNESLERLAQLSRGPLSAYVYRITFRDDLTEDIVQESLLEMFKVLGNLSKADSFWPWLCKIAFNKIRFHHRTEKRYKTHLKEKAMNQLPKIDQEGLENLVSEELKQIVRTAMSRLTAKHRAVLSLRCYENMKFSQISDLMNCSELNTRLLFYRAKKSLQKELSRNGLGKGALLMALVIFGKMSAPSEAAAAQIAVTSSTLNVGLLAQITGMLTGKAAVTTLTTAGIATVASLTIVPGLKENKTNSNINSEFVPAKISVSEKENKQDQECWYFFPEGPDGSVMMRLMKWDAEKKWSYCKWLQNDKGNYSYDARSDAVYIHNHRSWSENLSTCLLPTDNPDMSQFIRNTEGSDVEIEHVPWSANDLLIVSKQKETGSWKISQATYNYDLLQEEHFKYSWPSSARIIDIRDSIHKQGWAYFRVKGKLNDQTISGTGSIPFVYSKSKTNPAWIRLKLSDQIELLDCSEGATLVDNKGSVITTYPSGTFLHGLARPWMGFHCIDSIRRDAAKYSITFETSLSQDREKAQISLNLENARLIYTVNMENDLIEKITFWKDQNNNQIPDGELYFTFVENNRELVNEFNEPNLRKSSQHLQGNMKNLWLADLFNETLIDR